MSAVGETATATAEPSVEQPVPRWVAPAFLVIGVGLIPWTIVLALTLPNRHGTHHYGLAWTGFDLALAGMLVAPAVGAARRSSWLQGSATAAATLLVCDAWFDVLSSVTNGELVLSIVLAVFVELPVAAACMFVARHSEETSARARRYAAYARRRRSRSSRGTV